MTTLDKATKGRRGIQSLGVFMASKVLTHIFNFRSQSHTAIIQFSSIHSKDGRKER